MSPGRRPARPHRPQQQPAARPKAPQPVDLWGAKPALDDPAPVAPAADPTAVLRSLGTPPLPGQAATADHHLASVVLRASHLATALAAAADLLAEPTED